MFTQFSVHVQNTYPWMNFFPPIHPRLVVGFVSTFYRHFPIVSSYIHQPASAMDRVVLGELKRMKHKIDKLHLVFLRLYFYVFPRKTFIISFVFSFFLSQNFTFSFSFTSKPDKIRNLHFVLRIIIFFSVNGKWPTKK